MKLSLLNEERLPTYLGYEQDDVYIIVKYRIGDKIYNYDISYPVLMKFETMRRRSKSEWKPFNFIKKNGVLADTIQL